MMEAPTLSRFLLRSRVLWLTVFTLVFLSWAWWDSMEYSTELHYRSKSGRAFSIHSCNGGIGYTSGGDVGLFVMLFSEKKVFGDMKIFRGIVLGGDNEKLYTLYSRPDVTYGVFMVITLGLCSASLLWRWRVICKHTQEDNLTNR
jgi:hypothetical protein